MPSVRAALATLLTIAAIASPYFFIVQSFYIHESLAGAVYLFFAATSFWLAEQERERAWLPFAFLYLLAFSLHRVDGPIVAMILLVIVCGASRMPARPINWGVLIFSVVSLVWLGAQAMLQPPDGAWLLRPAGPNLDSARLGVLMLVYVVSTGCLLSLRHPRMVRLRDWIPLLVIALLICALGAASIWRPSFADATIVGVIGIAAYPSWGGIWYIFLVLGALSLLLPKERHDRILSYGTLATLLFILLLSVMHDREFSSRWGDSINRMMTYLIPIFSFYLLMIYVRAPLFWDREKQLDPPSQQLDPVRETA